ncbi:hypothetical protein LWI28_027854 [Acer negundo]|uniref:Cyclic nucleotide-binding domain-containing protein n=1 Tax=Acer negundo TaxID=4023 RepID=A0AAD5IHK0_ACENE|nr:hypothetical protein LWI28_027854 [Acer negundo]
MGWQYGSMTESVATQVMGCSTSANLWKALENLYGAHLKSKMNAVRTNIQTTRKGTMSMEEYLKQMKSWADVLAIVGDPYLEQLLISNVLSELDADYMPIVVLIESCESISWQELQDTLLSYASKLEHINSLNKIVGAPSANYVTSRGGNSNFNKNYSQSQPSNQSGGRGQNTGRSRRGGRFCGRGGRNSNNSRPTCQVCGKYGHSAAHCYNRYDESYTGASSNSNQNKQNQLQSFDTQEVESSSSLNQGASLPDHARADTQEVESSSSLNHSASLLDHATPVNSQVHETDASQNIPYDGPLCSQVPVKVLLYSLVLIPRMEIRASVFSVLLAIFLAVYLMRIIGIYRLFTRSTSSKLAEYPFTSIIKIAFNLLLFLYGGHLFGGLWYLFAVWKQLACWRNVCLEQDHQICHYANNRFNVNPEGNKLLSDTCFAKIEDTYELGIFKDAFESHILEETSELGKNLFYCFRWGLQNVSGFGTNLQVSTYTWENIFVVLITVYGVGTFTYFIGNMQNVINSAIDERRKKEEHQEIKQQLEQWFTFRKLSKNLRNRIEEKYPYNDKQTKAFDVEILSSKLPMDVKNDLKSELGLELITKVERFRRWSDASLRHLCDCIKLVVYDELTCIVREGDPINEMLFVLHGKLWNFSSAASSTNNVPPHDWRKDFLKDGDFRGEELVNWVQDESSYSSSSNKLISHTTIKALTKVEAFVLRIDDLQKLFNEKAKILQSWFRKRKKQGRWMELLAAIKSNRERTPPGDQFTGPENVV